MDYNRINQKPLMYGLEESLVYKKHQNEATGFIENNNNNIFVTWNSKEVHFWKRNTGTKQKIIKIIDISKINS